MIQFTLKISVPEEQAEPFLDLAIEFNNSELFLYLLENKLKYNEKEY